MISETFSKLKTAFGKTTGNIGVTRKRRASSDSENIGDGIGDEEFPTHTNPPKIQRLDTPLQPLAEQLSPNWFSWTKNSVIQAMSRFSKGSGAVARKPSTGIPPVEITIDDDPLPEPSRCRKSKGGQPALTRPSLNRATDDPDVVFIGSNLPTKCATMGKPTSKKDSVDRVLGIKHSNSSGRKEHRKMSGSGYKKFIPPPQFPYYPVHGNSSAKGRSIHDRLFAGDSVRLQERYLYQSLLDRCSAERNDADTSRSNCGSSFFGRTKSSSVLNVEKLDHTFRELFQHRVSSRYSAAAKPVVSPSRDSTDEVQWVRSVSKNSEILELSPPSALPKTKPLPVAAAASFSSSYNRSLALSSRRSPATTSPSANRVMDVVDLDCSYERSINRPSTSASKYPDITNGQISLCKYTDEKWLTDIKKRMAEEDKKRDVEIGLCKADQQSMTEKRMRDMQAKMELLLKNTAVIVDVEEEESALPELTPEMNTKIDSALKPNPPNQILVDAFNLSVRRKDIETLAGLNWLNDEVMNFYFTMLMERGKLDNFPSVYVQNTFFYPKLLKGGHDALKRWTRKVDIFGHDLMLVPVHLGMHWCLAVVDFRQKRIQYYDSMGGSNAECLRALLNYLEKESLDKRKAKLDASEWTTENVKDVPQQLNGSDCGMFTCKYAEYLSRDKKITFTQDDMPYFRRRMVYEIISKQLL